MLKAAREAKADTNWIEPDQQYEADLQWFVRGMLADPDVAAEIDAVIVSMTPEWQELSLSQTLIKLTAPGIPDIYQGSELWDLRLVDPDNRTPVDFEAATHPARRCDAAGRRCLHVGARVRGSQDAPHRRRARCTRAPQRGVRQRLRISARCREWFAR